MEAKVRENMVFWGNFKWLSMAGVQVSEQR